MSTKNVLSARTSSARALLLAAVAAPCLFAASSADAAFSFGVHVITSKLSLWITIGTGNASGVSTTGDAGHISAMETGGPAGLSMAMGTVELPPFNGSPTAPLQASELGMAMTSMDVLGGMGGPVTEARQIGVWVTGRGWGVHIIIYKNASEQMALAGMESNGNLRYSSIPGTFTPADVEFIDPNGVSSFETQAASLVEFDAPAPLPTPGSAALLGLGGLAAFRRRR